MRRFLRLLQKWDYSIYNNMKKAIRDVVINESYKVRDAWEEILHREEFTKIKWEWE